MTSLAAAFPLQDEPMRIENIDWKVEGDVVLITYDLIASSEELYRVDLVLKNEKDASFRYVPEQTSGAIGEGEFGGVRRVIRWEYRKDVPEGFSGDGYYFEITVESIHGMSPWVYVAGGVAVVGGAAILLLGKSGGTLPPKNGKQLPDPPVRP